MNRTKLKLISRNSTLLDFGVVEEGITTYTKNDISRNIAFSKYVMSSHFHVAPDEIDRWIVDGGNDAGIDIFYRDEENATINIGNCKTVSTYKKSKSNFPGVEINKVILFVKDFLSGHEGLLDRVNPKFRRELSLAFQAMEDRRFRVNVHLFSNQLTLADHERTALRDSLAQYGPDVTLFEHGLYELAHGAVVNSKPRFKKKIKPLRSYETNVNDIRSFRMEISLESIAKFVCFDNENAYFDERLLHHNVRYFLGVDNLVNKEISKTLIEGSGEFWLKNNGITIVCQQIVGTPCGSNPFTLLNPQIVNGGQTAKMIHLAATSMLQKSLVGSVDVKLIETADHDLIDRIAVSSNSQTRIFGRDLRANDDIQAKISIALRGMGYFYRRKFGETSVNSTLEPIDALRAGQLLLSYKAGEPNKSKTASNEIFENLYPIAFGDDPCPQTLIAVHCLHKELEGRRASVLAKLETARTSPFDENWIVEGHFHVIFVVGLLLQDAGISLSNAIEAVNYLSRAIEIVELYVKQNPGVSSYRLFRSAHSKIAIQRIMMDSEERSPVEKLGQQLRFDV